MSTWVGQYKQLELFCLWTKVHQKNFLPNVEEVVVHHFFQMFDMSIRSGNIRDQSRKLSEIAPKFGRFLAVRNLWGRAVQKLYARYHPCLAACCLEKFHEDSPTSPEVIEARTLNFKPNFNFRN